MNILTEKASKIIIWIGLFVLTLGLIIFLYKENLFIEDALIKSDKIGQFGDFIGGVAGAIWALAGVILFYVALDKQKEALSLQLNEFNLQREELEKTREIFNEQSNTQIITQFETSFYNLLNLFQKIVNDFNKQVTVSNIVKDSYSTGSTYNNKEYFPAEYQYLIKEIKGRGCINEIYSEIDSKLQRINENKTDILKEYYEKYEVFIIPYFNIILQILIKIEKCPLDNRNDYLDIFKAMFSFDEVKLIAYFRDADIIDIRFDSIISIKN